MIFIVCYSQSQNPLIIHNPLSLKPNNFPLKITNQHKSKKKLNIKYFFEERETKFC